MDEDTQEGTGTEVALPVDQPVDAISAPPVGQQKAARGATIESELLVRGSAAQRCTPRALASSADAPIRRRSRLTSWASGSASGGARLARSSAASGGQE